MKEWSLDDVAIAHRYDVADSQFNCEHHDLFSEWLRENTSSPRVFDIGCCSGIALYRIKDHVSEYFGVDLSNLNINKARSAFTSEKYRFEVHDIEIDTSILENLNYDVCYIDSVLEMLEEPERVLEIVVKKFDYVFLNRTSYSSNEIQKSSYQWAGMNSSSILWKFPKKLFVEVAERNNCNVQFKDKNIVIFNRIKSS